MTRVQRERFTDLMEYEKVKNVYILKNDMLAGAKDNLKILHPLPRVNEIQQDVDDSPKACLLYTSLLYRLCSTISFLSFIPNGTKVFWLSL